MKRTESEQAAQDPRAPTRERFGIRYAGHDVEVGVAPGDASANGAVVVLDGMRLDPGQLHTRAREIGFTTDDGVEFRLHLAGRAERPLGRVALRRADGYWVDLVARDEPGTTDGAAAA